MTKARILIVEDELIVAEDLKMTLTKLGYDVIAIASTGERAIEIALSGHPDLILMDIMLTGKIDGIMAAEQICARQDIPVIYVTAYADEPLLQRAKLTCPFGYIIKPFNDRELYITIDMALAKHALERKLKENEKKYHSIFDNAVMGIYQVSGEGRFLSANNHAARIFGYKSAEKLIQSLTDINTQIFQDPKTREGAQRILLEKGILENFEAPCRHKDGHTVWVSFNARLVRDADGNILYYEGTSQDITQRKKAEEALRESELRLADIISFLPDATLVIDKNGTVLAWNRAMEEMTGVPKEQMIGKAHYEYALPFYNERRPIEIDLVLHDDPVVVAKYPFMKKEGKSLLSEIFIPHLNKGKGAHLWSVASPLYDTAGNLTGAIESIRDISDQKQAENALAAVSKKLKLLFSITRHDINNQLTVLLGYLTLLKKKQPDLTNNEYFQEIATAAKSISTMIRYTKEYEQIGVNVPVWKNCCTLVDIAAKNTPLGQVMLKNDLPAGLEVFIDPMVVMVCNNLMDNAVQHGGKITTIRFSGEKSGDDYLVICEDDGDGVSQDIKKKIFDKGFGKNPGLGLFLSREILSITGITITENGIPGKGARFEIHVPSRMWKMREANI